MAYAPGITLRPWTVGGTTTTESGEALFTRAKVTASRSLMLWGATAWRYESSTKTITSTEGAQVSGELPVCDQSGWRTEGGAVIDVSVPLSYTHTYTIKVSQFRKDSAGREIPVGEERTYANVFIPTGDLSPFDLDAMLPVSTVAGGVVLVPDTWGSMVAAAEAAATSSALNAPASMAALGLRTALASGTTTTGIAVVGDSTGNETSEWPSLLGIRIAEAHPALTVRQMLWSDAAQDLVGPVTIQTGTAGEQYLDTTAGAASRALSLSRSPHTPGALDVRVRASLPDWTPADVNVLVAREGGAGKRSWYLVVGASGTVTLHYSVDGSSLLSAASTVAPTVADGEKLWLRATYTPGVSTVFYTSMDGLAWTQLGAAVANSTGALFDAATPYELGGRQGGTMGNTARIYAVDVRTGVDGAPIVPRLPALWGGSSIAAPVVGAPVLTLVNGSHPGAGLGYWTAARLAKALPDYGQQVAFLSLSHNEAASCGPDFGRRYIATLAALRAQQPHVPIVALTQNPQVAPREAFLIAAHAARRADIFTATAATGTASVDTYAAFAGVTATAIGADGIHPTATGSALWRDVVADALGL